MLVDLCIIDNRVSYPEHVERSMDDYQNLNMVTSLFYKIIGLLKDSAFSIGTLFSRSSHKDNYAGTIVANDETGALIVLIHGLNGHPSILDGHYDFFQNRSVTIYQPYVWKKGYCPLEEAAASIYENVLAWAKQYPQKPLVFVGVSNGARLSGYISAKLVKSGNITNPIKVSSIAGPFRGTRMLGISEREEVKGGRISKTVDIIKSVFGVLYMGRELAEELRYKSGRAKRLMENMRDAAATHPVSYDFYATKADSRVTCLDAALPERVEGAYYEIMEMEGHSSIVRAIKERQGERCMEFVRVQEMKQNCLIGR
ncbi:MAG: hypothetical protein ACI9S8_001808 [Chlamydiales bacterium]|jgi:hypothetical protein